MHDNTGQPGWLRGRLQPKAEGEGLTTISPFEGAHVVLSKTRQKSCVNSMTTNTRAPFATLGQGTRSRRYGSYARPCLQVKEEDAHSSVILSLELHPFDTTAVQVWPAAPSAAARDGERSTERYTGNCHKRGARRASREGRGRQKFSKK